MPAIVSKALVYFIIVTSILIPGLDAQSKEGKTEEERAKKISEELNFPGQDAWQKIKRTKTADIQEDEDDDRKIEVYDLRDILGISEDDVEANEERKQLIETMVKQLIRAPSQAQFQLKSGLLVATASSKEHRSLRQFFSDFRRYAGRSYQVELSLYPMGVLRASQDPGYRTETPTPTDISFLSREKIEEASRSPKCSMKLSRSMTGRLRNQLSAERKLRYVVGWREESEVEGFKEALLIPDLKEIVEGLRANLRIIPAPGKNKLFTVELDLHCSRLKGEVLCRESKLGRVWDPQLEERDIKTTVVLPDGGGIILGAGLPLPEFLHSGGDDQVEILIQVNEMKAVSDADE